MAKPSTLGDKKIPCQVRGCKRTWLWRGAEQAKAIAAGAPATPTRMCDLCAARAQLLADQALACTTPTCAETTPWTTLSQLEAIFAHTGEGAPPTPRHLCEACRAKAAAIGDRTIPCAVAGCTRTTTWSGRDQLAAGATPETPAPDPGPRMCEACAARAAELRDQKIACRVRGCRGKWIWPKQARLEAEATGGGRPPERMCEACETELATLADEEIACRNEGCRGTWTLRRMHKLETLRAGGGAPEPRPCAACQTMLGKLRDVQAPCKRSGCKGTWLYRRGAQLERWIKAGSPETELAPPQRLCDACRRGLDAFTDREVRCKNEGCAKTWTWSRFAQLQAREGGHGAKPPHHMCDDCKTFLTDLKTKTIVCTSCAAEIHWAPELQLKTHLGLMQEPTLCGTCKQKAAKAAPRRVLPPATSS